MTIDLAYPLGKFSRLASYTATAEERSVSIGQFASLPGELTAAIARRYARPPSSNIKL